MFRGKPWEGRCRHPFSLMNPQLAKAWDRYRRIPKAIKWVVWPLVAILVAWCGEDFRGRYQLAQFQEEWRARGVELDWNRLPREDPPPELDFNASPVLREWFEAADKETTKLGEMGEIWGKVCGYEYHRLSPEPGMHTGIRPELYYHFETPTETDQTLAAKAAAELAPYKETFQQLAEAARLPNASAAHFRDPTFETVAGGSGYLWAVLQCIRACQLKALVAFHEGDADAAVEDLITLLRLGWHVGIPEHQFIGTLAGMTGSHLGLELVWEGYERGLWERSHIERLATELAQLAWTRRCPKTMHQELVFSDALAEDLWTHHRWQLASLSPFPLLPSGRFSTQVINLGLGALPSGAYCMVLLGAEQSVIPHLVHRGGELYPELEIAAIDDAKAQTRAARWPYRGIVESITQTHFGGAERMLHLQQLIDFAQLATALELWKLDQGSYPENLTALVPHYMIAIPLDRFDASRQVVYELTPNGRYRLSACGMNRIYEGALPSNKRNKGDIVWQYSSPTPGGAP